MALCEIIVIWLISPLIVSEQEWNHSPFSVLRAQIINSAICITFEGEGKFAALLFLYLC